jgi:pyruvate ferredoxin oxidoreductase alpha subunit
MALERIPQMATEFRGLRPRPRAAWCAPTSCEDAETIVVALGSVLGTIKDTIDEMRDDGIKIGVLGIHSFRPFPLAAVRAALQGRQARRGAGKELLGRPGRRRVHRRAPGAAPAWGSTGYTVIAGLGGRAITKASAARTLREAIADELEPLTFLDLDWRIVNRQLEREAQMRRSGPIAENLLRDVGTVASKGEEPDMHCNPSSSTRPAPSPSATACSRPNSAACRPAPSAATR